MFTRLLWGAAAAALFASTFAQTGPAGHWEATVKADGRETGLALDLARNEKSEWIASMGVPSQNVTGLVVSDLAVSGDSVKFTAVSLMMSGFDLTLTPDGILKGTISTRREPVPVEFKRTGEAKVQLIPPSPAVSRELEGDWEGTLQTPNRAFRILFHFKNQPDKTVVATIDTPDTGGRGLPLNDVKQSGQEVEVGIRIAHASFRGKLNPEGTELAGQFTHEQESLPLTLRKK